VLERELESVFLALLFELKVVGNAYNNKLEHIQIPNAVFSTYFNKIPKIG
jgi:hypothetical protein